MNLNTIFNRVANWNELRYPRIHNRQLTIELLREEHMELMEAQTPVDRLDALCDITYVAMGALWKLKLDRLTLGNLGKVNCWLNSMIMQDDVMMLHGVIAAAISRIEEMGLTEAQCLEALLIVCDSNDTKSSRLTAPGIKANIDKGDGFIAPGPRLKLLLGSVPCNK